MNLTKSLGISMDDSEAYLIARDGDCIETSVIKFDFPRHDNLKTLQINGNRVRHDNECHRQSDFYQKISQKILKYDDIIIFGSTNAKHELVDILDEDVRYDKIKIDVKQTDKMTENQAMDFVKQHFKFHGLKPTI